MNEAAYVTAKPFTVTTDAEPRAAATLPTLDFTVAFGNPA